MKDNVYKTIEQLQKEIFGLNSSIEDLIILYKYPTRKVNLFFEKIEQLFNIKFDERPNTITEIISEISLSSNKSYWE